MDGLIDPDPPLEDIARTKLRQFAAEAAALEVGDLLDIAHPSQPRPEVARGTPSSPQRRFTPMPLVLKKGILRAACGAEQPPVFMSCSYLSISPSSRRSMMEWAMSANMQVVLEGLPERVQETADMLDWAFPGLMTWRRFAVPGQDCAMRLKGKAAARNGVFPRPRHLPNQAPALGKTWKLSPAAGGTIPRRSQFCASLSKSFAEVSAPVEVLPDATAER